MYTACKYVGLVSIAASAVLLSGCWVQGGISCRVGTTCDHPDIGIHGGTGQNPGGGGGPPVIINSQRPLVTAFTVDPSSVHIDLNGTDYDVGSVGMASITLRDSSTAVIASRAFSWVRSGNDLVFQHPSIVESWVSGYPNAVSADATVDAGTIPADQTSHTLSAALYYDGAKQTSVSRTFPAFCEVGGGWEGQVVSICP